MTSQMAVKLGIAYCIFTEFI